ncbi:hypothetical protein ACFS5M_12265 [Lacinutrix iliipiscaria]|uniref:Uncharacterized protein n=1 Tax=Lacinutrix iliipiscaria TaxID=1230532 RepID=A0ABW5WNZ0_9FLAO
MANFSKEFYHWLVVSDNEVQRVRVWLVALARTKLTKETEPIGKSAGFSEYTQTSNWLYTLLANRFLIQP